MREAKYKGKIIYVDDSKITLNDTGVMSPELTEEELDKTREIDLKLDEKDLELDTITDLWDDDYDN